MFYNPVRVEKGRALGLANRKYENVCTYCGKEEHYSKGLCRACYARLKRNGTLEKRKAKEKPEPKREVKRRETYDKCIPKNTKELFIVICLGNGLTYKEIGDKMNVSKQYVSQIIKKMRERSENEED